MQAETTMATQQPTITPGMPIEAQATPVAQMAPQPVKSQIQADSGHAPIKPSLIRYPLYDYKSGTQFYLSKTEQIVVDAYLKCHSATEATRALNALFASHGSARKYDVGVIDRWLKKPHVARYIADKLQDEGAVNWFDQKKWEAWGVDVMANPHPKQVTSVQVAIWKEFGKARGWYKEGGPQIQNNTQINFMQSDGKQ